MNMFSEIATKLLWDYKNLLKKYLNPKERTEKLKYLGLQGKALLQYQYDEVPLYHKVTEVINDIETWITNDNDLNLGSWYSGIKGFLQHAKNTLENYQIDNGEVIHTAQKASHAMINIIQYISMPTDKLTSDVAGQIDEHASTIAKHGSSEQQKVITDAFKNHGNRQPDFFMPILHRFNQHLMDFDSRE